MHDRADQLVILEHRDRGDGPITTKFNGANRVWITLDVRFCLFSIVNLRHLVCGGDLPKSGIRWWSHLLTLAGLDVCWWRIVYATARNKSVSRRYNVPNLASQIRVAFSSIALKTGSSSPGEVLITLSTSAVAVCCCSDSESSRVRPCTSSNKRRSQSRSPPGRQMS